ncbi:MAG: valine--tRNA ligase [Peptococcaceae bacterium]|nr:valine--tRNA ligase [Peptococcaceae bacterium]
MSIENLEKQYDSSKVENRWYEFWEHNHLFAPSADRSKPAFSIVMPPPNVTGKLHMGHAMDETMQDILVRYKRLKGYRVLWVPGTDHAGIATQAKVDNMLREQGISREDIGREKFVDHCWDWKKQYGDTITRQIRKLGASCDWDRERFTMDEGCSRAVREAFVSLYEQGLIYQGNYIVNWCPHCHTTISDIEVEHEDNQGALYYLNYPLEDGSGKLTIATTRPETMFGDTAVAVHPDDERYKDFIGKNVILPIINKPIPVIADEYVEMEFGTGAVKITPSHDVNDFEMGERHKLPHVVVMDDYGVMNENAGKYQGMDRFECRKQVIKDLEGTPYFDHTEDYSNSVGHCYRCHTVIEPRVSKQWFVRMEQIAKPALQAVLDKDIQFVPERFEKVYIGWLENIRDWCISRQLWWGHRIPVWYCQDCGEVICTREDPTVCPSCGSHHLKQDEDVLDTWFSSGLWPFEVMGWPDTDKDDYKDFYPTDVLVTGRDIIFFWVARMIFDAYKMTDQRPFKDVLIHGLVLDQHGRKMSKSLGNGIDPLEEIDKYGADALRLTLVTGVTPGNDVRYRSEKIEAARNFTNKLWNAARFVLMNLEDFQGTVSDKPPVSEDMVDQWIITRFYEVAEKMSAELDHFDFGEAAKTIKDFIWNEFCDWYIEMIKPRLYGRLTPESKLSAQETAAWILRETTVLLHPIMPFITEEIWQHLPHDGESIIISQWPENTEGLRYDEAYKGMDFFMDLVKGIRAMRYDMGIPTGKKSALQIHCHNEEQKAVASGYETQLKALAYADEVTLLADISAAERQSVSSVVQGAEVVLPLRGVLDLGEELARLQKEMDRLASEVTRAEKKLANQGFVAKAPEAVVQAEKDKVESYKLDLEAVKKRYDMLSELENA